MLSRQDDCAIVQYNKETFYYTLVRQAGLMRAHTALLQPASTDARVACRWVGGRQECMWSGAPEMGLLLRNAIKMNSMVSSGSL